MSAQHTTMRTRTLLTCMVWPALFVTAMASGATPMHLVSIEPTVLFTGPRDNPLQVVDVTIQNDANAVAAELEVKIGDATQPVLLGTIEKGQSTIQIRVADVREAAPARFVLKVDGREQDSETMQWRPRRHWTIYFVPITHHDLGYTDTIENVMKRYAGFYDDVLRFCADTNDWPDDSKYRYTIEGSWSAQYFAANRPPEVVDKLGAYMKEGRIEIGALHGNEISGLCGHEELIRLMYPSFRFQRRYGAEIRTGSITDVPGLSWGLPTVMADAGVKYFFAGLPTYFEWGRNDVHTFWDESAILRHGRPDAFRWEGPDGQDVLVYYQASYGFFKRVIGPDSYQEVMEYLPGALTEMEEKGSPFSVMRYIHNGVDNYPPDVRISHVVKEWNGKWAYPRLIVATNTMFFEALEKQCQDVRTFRGELPHTDYTVGALSTAKETTVNRLTHDKLLSAEKAATVASLIGDETSYPADEISDAYDNMLLYDEHTWGKDYPTGALQDWAWNEKSHFAYKAAGLAQSVLSESLRRIAERIQFDEQQRHIVVFNPLSFARTDIVRVTRLAPDKPFDLIDDVTGRKVPYQFVKLDGPLTPTPYAPQRWARGHFEPHEWYDLVFRAEDVPPVGYKTYRLVPAETEPAFEANLTAIENVLENRFFRIMLDPKTGGIMSLYDKELARELVDPQAPHKVNQLVARSVRTGDIVGSTDAKIRVGRRGPVYASLIAQSTAPGCPQVTQEVVLYDDVKRIDLSNRVLKDSWPLIELYFAFPFEVAEPKFRFEASNSVIEPLRDQFPGSNSNYYSVQHWAAVSNDEVGVTLSPVEAHLLEFGGLWPCYVSQAHHGLTPPYFGDPFVTAEQMTQGYMYSFVLDSNFRTNFQPVQQSDILYRYSLTSSAGAQPDELRRDFGWSVHSPLIAMVVEGRRDGPLARHASFCHVDAAHVLISTIKRAEDGQGLIVRLLETAGREAAVTLTVPYLTVEKAWRTSVVEENQAELPCQQHQVTVPIKPYSIATLRLQTQQ